MVGTRCGRRDSSPVFIRRASGTCLIPPSEPGLQKSEAIHFFVRHSNPPASQAQGFPWRSLVDTRSLRALGRAECSRGRIHLRTLRRLPAESQLA